MALYTFDPKKLAVIFKNVPLFGFAEGTFVNVELDDDDWVTETGSDGNVTRVAKANAVATATITLSQSSPSNNVLSGFRSVDLTSGLGSGTFRLVDGTGSTLIFSPAAFIKKPPAAAFGDETNTREWIITLTNPKWFIGGNILNPPLP